MPRKKKSEKEESDQERVIISEVQVSPESSEKTSEKPAEQTQEKKKSYVGWLIFLIIILIALDLISLYIFYKPDLTGFADFFKFKQAKVIDDIQKCEDGTAYNSCSNNKPYYCYEGDLMKNANLCGCPEGYVIDFQTCKKTNSS